MAQFVFPPLESGVACGFYNLCGKSDFKPVLHLTFKGTESFYQISLRVPSHNRKLTPLLSCEEEQLAVLGDFVGQWKQVQDGVQLAQPPAFRAISAKATGIME